MRIRRRIARRRYAIAVLASVAAAAGGPTAALAVPADAPVHKYPNPALTVTPSDFANNSASRIGDTPAEFGQRVAPAPGAGDTPVDYPGASRAPQSVPTHTVTVVRPERTIVRDTDPILPVILASLALVVALGIAGAALVRSRSLRLGRAG